VGDDAGRMTHKTLAILALLLLIGIACDSPRAAVESVQAPAVEATVAAAPVRLTEFEQRLAKLGPEPYDWCAVFRGQPQGCVACPSGSVCPPVQAASIIHCCNADGICVHTMLMGNCDPDDYVVICNWGTSNSDGTITCYE